MHDLEIQFSMFIFWTQRLGGVLGVMGLSATLWCHAQPAFPSKPITLVVPTAAGGTTDLSARMLAQALSPVLGQSIVVDNKGGGNGNIAASQVKRAPADGYTLLFASGEFVRPVLSSLGQSHIRYPLHCLGL